MSQSDRPTDETIRPAGAAGDGMDAYPTYHDGPAPARGLSGTRPTDPALPRAKRSYALPILIGLIVFALVIVVRIVWGGINVARTSDEALTPGDPAATTTSAPAGAAPPAAGTDVPDTDTAADSDAQAEPATGPGEVEATPGGADVPGGATTTPVLPAPAQ